MNRIVSGGQTGADRAALDWAIKNNIPHGGWCPKGRLAEDGLIPSRYNLKQTPSEEYALRTEWNVRDSDATLIISISGILTGGTALTKKLALQYHKPVLHVHAEFETQECASRIKTFIQEHYVKILNIAGPRASKEPRIDTFVTEVLNAAFTP